MACCIGFLALCLGTQAARAHLLPHSWDIQFTRITADDGISHTAAQRIMQDSHGFIWVGTQQGLNRFDGYEFEVFNYTPDDPQSLSNGWIYDIFEDRSGRIWIATDGGLDLFQAASRNFQHFRHDPARPDSLPNNSVRTISQTGDGAIWVGTRSGLSRWNGDEGFTHFISFDSGEDSEARPAVRALAEDRQGNLWIGTHDKGLIRLNPATGEQLQFEHDPDAENSIGGGYVRSILIAHEGTVWAGTQSGGISLVDGDGNVTRLTHDPENPNTLSSDRIWRIFQDRQGRIWVGTEAGLNLWEPETNSFHRYFHDETIPSSLSDNNVYDITQDRGNVIWVGTFNGISKWNSEIATFTHIKREEDTESTLSNNKVTSFAEAPDGRLWIGTIGGGIDLWDVENNSFEQFTADENNPDSLADNMVISLLQDDQDRLWAGTMRKGLSMMDLHTRTFTNFTFDRDNPSSISSNAVSNMLQDSKGQIWIATYGGGLNLYLGKGRFRRYPLGDEPNRAFPSYFLVDIEEGLDGRLWLASDGGGVIRFDPETQEVEVMQFSPGSESTISDNHVICLLQTRDALWVGTRDTGLNRYQDDQWQHFDYGDGLASNAIYGLLEDETGRIWISHSKGLSSLDPENLEFTNYDTIHGLQGNDFNNGSYLKTADGKLLFGGSNGFNIFYPSDVQVNTHHPQVKLTRFTKFNRDFQLERPSYELESIELSYDDYVVGFEFAAMDFTDPAENQYRYMLAGFDREWVSADRIRQATYTNLGPGDYNFRVQGSNNDGVWNDTGLSVALKVSPAPWATWWAMALYTMVAIAVVYGTAQAYSVRLHREEQRRYSEQLEALVAERTSALESEITGHKTAQQELSRSLQEKEVLLKEVHHRVKNNMQVISSLLNIQADSVLDERFQTLLTESQQRIKSMALIHENLYRSESLLEINFHDYIEMLTAGLVRFYRFDRLAVSLQLQVENIYLDIDTAVPCGLIINELVSNSLKHGFKDRTGEGHILVRFAPRDDGMFYEFSVSDDGNGIPDDMDIENASSMGLEIVRILTEQLDGNWSWRSENGTEFTIEFPRKK
jgi:two-component sensor histidine kinase/ligand-binding sensor domain-containing protein